MRVLVVGRYKHEFDGNLLPFVIEQGLSLERQGVEVFYFPIQGNYLSAVRDLKRKILDLQPDILHAHYGLSAITAELQSFCPVITTFHNGETSRWYVNFITSLFSLRARYVIYVAEHIREKLFFVNKNHSILPCGVSLDDCYSIPYEQARAILGFEENKKYILFGGAFSNKRKNFDLLNEALDLPSIKNNFKFEVLEMKNLSRAECVLRMCACDAFALPSRSEGSPQALKEAMACGCPCLATDIADVRKLIGGLNGNYVCSFDPVDVAHGLDMLLSLPIGFRTTGRERIIELGYTNELVAEKLIEIYKSIIDR